MRSQYESIRCIVFAALVFSGMEVVGRSQDTSGPVRVSLRVLESSIDQKPTQIAPKHKVQLGNRDDTRAESYSVENRGKELPAGNQSGRYCDDGFRRAGYPWLPGAFASHGTDAKHSVGYVGGSTPFHAASSGILQGEYRKLSEGTFGYDYSGLYYKRNTWLLWTHGRRDQGGSGRYQTDGPRVLPEK